MVLQLFIGLLAIASASLLITQGRRRKIWSILILASLVMVSYMFAENLSSNLQDGFIYQWLPYSEIKSDFHIASSLRLQKMFLPLMIMLMGLVGLNIIYPPENHSLHASVLFILSFVSFILQISGNDFMQLMFAGCMFSIIGFYIPDIVYSRKRIFIFNFLSEMAVFAALSIVYGKTGTTSLAALSKFSENGIHKDLVAVLLMFAIACKCGFYLVNGQYLLLKDTLFNRISGIMLMSLPLSGVVLLIKVHPLLSVSTIPGTVLPVWSVITMVSCIFTALINSNIQTKFITICLSFYAFMVYIFFMNNADLYDLIPYFLLSCLIISLVFVQIIYSLSYNKQINYSSVSWKTNKIILASILFLLFTLMFLFNDRIPGTESRVFISVLFVVIASILKMVYFRFASNAVSEHHVWAEIICCIFSFIFFVFTAWQTRFWNCLFNYEVLAFFTFSLILMPIQVLINFGNSAILQKDILNQIYERAFIFPLKTLGRILWLAFDVVIIERSIVTGMSHVYRKIVSLFHTLQNDNNSWFYGILLGIIFIFIYLGVN